MAHAERDLGAGADAEIENKERQDRHLRDRVEQQHQRQRGAQCKTAEPDRQPDRDAGDDREHKRDHELDERSLERGLHARIAEHARHRRNDGGWRTEEIGIEDGVTGELPEDKHQNRRRPVSQPSDCAAGTSTWRTRLPPRPVPMSDGRFAHAGSPVFAKPALHLAECDVEDHRQEDHEYDVGEHLGRVHAFGEGDDAAAEPAQPGDHLAAQDRQEPDGAADPQAGHDHGQRGRQQHPAKQLPLAGAHRARHRNEARVDLADAADGVEHNRKECVSRAERDFRFNADAEEQDEQRQKHDERNREHAGEQRFEYHNRVARTADQISDRQTASARDRDRDQQLEQGYAEVAVKRARLHDCEKLVDHVRQLRKKYRADETVATDVVPERDQHDHERDLNRARLPIELAGFHRGLPGTLSRWPATARRSRSRAAALPTKPPTVFSISSRNSA